MPLEAGFESCGQIISPHLEENGKTTPAVVDLEAIRAVLPGRECGPLKFMRRSNRWSKLTDFEERILALRDNGLKNKEILEFLGLAPGTCRRISAAMQKRREIQEMDMGRTTGGKTTLREARTAERVSDPRKGAWKEL